MTHRICSEPAGFDRRGLPNVPTTDVRITNPAPVRPVRADVHRAMPAETRS